MMVEREIELAEKGSDFQERFPCSPSGGINPADTLISDLQPPELGDGTFLLLKLPDSWFVRGAPPMTASSPWQVFGNH